LAEERALRTISFPAISTGIYGYPLEEAAGIALREARSHLDGDVHLEEAIFVLFGKQAFEIYTNVLK
jgi:O-acetyl-ADP-ribose deacetylase (regulator of RNase III)